MRHPFHHSIENSLHTFTCLAAGIENVVVVTSDEVHYLVGNFFRHGTWHVYLVDDGYNLQVVVNGHVEIGDSLRLHSLSGIHYEKSSLACSNRAADLV